MLPALSMQVIQLDVAWKSHSTLMECLEHSCDLAVRKGLMAPATAQHVLREGAKRDCNILRQAIEEIIAELRIASGQGGYSA